MVQFWICKNEINIITKKSISENYKVIKLVSEEEIERVAKLMKIDVDEHKEYVEKVQSMIDYFDILDSAGVESEEISMQEIPISSLREDKHIPFDEKLIDKLNNYKGTYVRAPKMS